MHFYYLQLTYDRETQAYYTSANKSKRTTHLCSGVTVRTTRAGKRCFDIFIFADNSQEAKKKGLEIVNNSLFLHELQKR